MKHTHSIPNITFSCMLCFVMVVSAVQPGAAQKTAGPAPAPQAQSAVRYGYNANTGKLSFVGADPNAPIDVAGALALPAGSALGGLALIAPYAQGFGLKDPAKELNLEKSQSDGKLSTTRYQQTYQGIPIMAGELIVNADDQNRLVSLSGEISPDLGISTTPAIPAATARQNALGAVAKWYGQKPQAFTASQPALWIYDSRLLEPDGLPTALTWRMDVRATDISQPVNELVLVDARTGAIRLHFNQIDSSWSQSRTSDDSQVTDTPTDMPTGIPTATPTDVPTATDTLVPTVTPSDVPTGTPVPTNTPLPTDSAPVVTPGPTITPTPAETPTVEEIVNPLTVITRYVSTTGDDGGSNTCATLTSPCKTIQHAINVSAAGDIIRVASGTYAYDASVNTQPNVVVINNSITLSGGWDGSFTSQTGASTIDGGNVNNGILAQGSASTIAVERFVIQNSISHNSGAIYLLNANLTLRNSTVKNNNATVNGAGIFMDGTAVLTVINSTVSGNTAGGSGGGIFVMNGTLTIQYSTIAYNQSALQGGGLSRQAGAVTIKNSILADNTASIPSNGPDCYGTLSTSGYDIVGNTTACTFPAGTANQLNVDPKINSTLTDTPPVHVIQPGSPAVDAADLASCPATDEIGTVRPVDGDGDGSAGCDIGAYEFYDVEAPTSITASSGSGQVKFINQSFDQPLSALVHNYMGTPLSGVNVTFTAPGSGASGEFAGSAANSETVATDASGIATSSVFTANGIRGSYAVAATVGGLALPANFQLVNKDLPGVPESIAVSSGSGQVGFINQVFDQPLTALVLDDSGDPVGGVNVTFAAPGSGASGQFASSASNLETVATNTSGIATCSAFTANSIRGTYSVAATVDGVALPANFQLVNRNLPGIPESIAVSSGSGQAKFISQAFDHPLSALVLDSLGDPVGGALVTFDAPESGASGSFVDTDTYETTATTDSQGIATSSTLTANAISGAYMVAASVPGVDSPVQFQLENLAHIPTALSILAGSPQFQLINTAYSVPFEVLVVDQSENPMAGVSVTFSAPASGASGSFAGTGTDDATAVTDGEGIATAPAFTANATNGSFTVIATVSGIASPAQFQLINFVAALYVATTGVDTNDCATPSTPCLTINAAIGKASAGYVIFVAGGVYTGTGTNPVVTINKNISISGGWDASFVNRIGLSVIDGQISGSGISIPGGVTATLEYFNIQNSTSRGITNSGTLVLNQSAVTNNKNGGIRSTGSLTLNGTTVSGNNAFVGAGIDNVSGTLVLNNSTIASNNGAYGGGISVESGSATINNTTITKNTGSYGGGIGNGVTGSGGTVIMKNSILYGNFALSLGPNSYISIISAGYNLVGSISGFTFTSTTGDKINVDPKLGPLVGLPAFLPLIPGSPAIDAGNPLLPGSGGNACLAVDQRGVSRPAGTACDIGAFEYTAAGAAHSVMLVAGDSQRASPFNAFSIPLRIAVLDDIGSLVNGVSVTFSAPAIGASGVFSDSGTNSTTAITGADGTATAAAFTANDTLGAYTVSASVAGVEGYVVFHLQNVAWFVAPGGNDANSCAAPTLPCATINAAIAKASAGERIYVATGTYTGSTTSPVLTIGKNIGLSGGWDASFMNQTGWSIIDGQANRAGVTISSQVIVTMENFIIQNGYTAGPGSGIYTSSNVNLTLKNSFVRFNINYNPALAAGAIYQSSSGSLTLNNSSVNNNSSGINGTTVVLNNSTVSDNNGVGISGSNITLNNSTISGNADRGISISSGTLTLNNSTVSNNLTTRNAGGGIANTGGTVTMHNSILAGNHSPTAPDCSGTVGSIGYNIIGDTTGCTFSAGTGDQVGVDPKLGPLVGLPGYLPLAATSPAVDAGNTCLATDERGTARPVGAGCDIGSYEYTVPGAAAQLILVRGDSQHAVPSSTFAIPLQAVVLDSQGRPVSGVNVTFTAPASGAGGTFSGTNTNTITVTSDEVGLASVPFTANSVFGFYNLIAAADGLEGSLEYRLANLMWIVSPDGNDANSCAEPAQPCASINAALAKAYPNETIYVASGTYTGSGTGPIVTISKNLTLSGGWNSSFTAQDGISTIDGETARWGISIPAAASIVTILKFKIQNGNNFGINNTGNLTLNDSIVTGNQGGILNLSGVLTLNHTTISGNTTLGYGGGIDKGTVILNNSTITGNSAKAFTYYGNNRNPGYGGGIYCDGGCTFNNTIISNNTADDDGGGIYLEDGSLVVNNSTVSNNSAVNGGGGIYVSRLKSLSLTNATISNNSASNGGGVYNQGNTYIKNSTIADNLASAMGGGIYQEYYSYIYPQNSLIARNFSQGASPDCNGNVTSIGYNLIGNNSNCQISSSAGDLIGPGDNPIDPKLSSLINVGGNLVYALYTGSPAIDAGNPAAPGSGGAACEATDQRDVARPVGARCDMGAYEGFIGGDRSPLLNTFSARHGTTLPGVFLCDQFQPDCTSGVDPQADAAQTYAMDTYNFYLSHHNRDSIDNAGMVITSSVRYGIEYDNASWNGSQMVYGDANGYALAEDVVAHELTHGVTDRTSQLYYYYQSGAINESFSDLWGEFVDQTNYKDTDAAAVKWLIGEHIAGSGAVRDMKNPPHFKNPDKMTSSYYFKGWQDNGGVHTNSGINNKAVYLMTDGGSFNGKAVSGIGLNKVAAVYYEVQTHLLTSGSDYLDLYYALYQGCLNLVGGNEGITQADCQQVRNATDAVQMNLQPSANFNPEADLCPSGMSTSSDLVYFKDDLENGSDKWVAGTENGNGGWELTNGFAASGTSMLWGHDDTSYTDAYVKMASDITLPAGSAAFLHFNHAYDFEYGGYYTPPTSDYYDGAVLEYSLDGGAWQDANTLYSAGAKYGGTISSVAGNPLAGRSGFVGISHGYVSSRYNLASLAGHNVNFRWRVGTDEAYYAGGWYLDDVQIYACQGVPSIPPLVAPANKSLVTSYTPLLDWKDASPTPDHYQLQVATDTLFNTVAIDRNDLTVSNFTPTDALVPNTTYYWRVRSLNAVDGSNGWSTVYSFRTIIIPANLTAPGDGAALPTNRPTFEWDAVAGASSYTIQISRNDTFTSLVTTGSPLIPIFVPTSNLPTGIQLYWRVQAKGSNGPSVWSTRRSLALSGQPPSVPSLVSPATNTLTTIYTPTVSWAKVILQAGTFFGHYELQISTSPVFAGLALDRSDILTDINVATYTLAAGEALNPNTIYYWRVRAANSLGDYSGWSLTRILRTSLLPPTLSSPNDTINLLNNGPTFDWQDVSGATGYTIQISKNAAFSSLVGKYNVGPSNYTPTTDLPTNATLFWRVQSTGANGPSIWSGARSLTTANPPGKPSLVAPGDKALTTNYTPLLDWGDVKVPAGAPAFDRYQVQVDDNVDFSSPLIDTDGDVPVTNSNYTPLTPLPSNTTYYWRVRSYNTQEQYSAWSSLRSFRTALLPPIQTAPDDAVDLLNNRPTFHWQAVSGTSKYAIQISKNVGFTSLVGTYTVTSSTYIPTTDLPANMTLYWRVQSQGTNGPSAWSGYRTMFTANPPAIPVITSPANNALVNPLTTSLAWNIVKLPTGTEFSNYQLQLSTGANFNYIFSDWTLTDLNQIKYTLPSGVLDSGSTYYLRLRTFNTSGEYSSWSAVRKFRTTLLAPSLIAPRDGYSTSDTRPTFEWSNVTGATKYTLQVGTDTQFTTYLWFYVTTSYTAYTPSFDFPRGFDFYWRVKASGPNGTSPWSEIRMLHER